MNDMARSGDFIRAKIESIERRAQESPGDRIDDLTAEDEQILDRIWEETRVENEAKRAKRRARRK